jgi:hypothetical protein
MYFFTVVVRSEFCNLIGKADGLIRWEVGSVLL